MIFKGTWEKVLDGTKIQTRRPYKENQLAIGKIDYSEYIYHSFLSFPLTGINQVRIGKTQKDNWEETRLLWKVGRTYAVCPGRGKKSLGKIRIMEIRIEKVQAISCIDMIAEGLKTNLRHIDATMHLLDQWRDLWNSLYEGTPYSWGKNPDVWVLEFELVEKY